MRSLLLRGVLAGLLAGLLTSVVSLLLVEPVLDRAVALEGDGAGPVSRSTQRFVGLPLGLALSGLSLGLLFAVGYRLLPSGAPSWYRSLGLAGGAFVALALIPSLRYPANPPGVGSEDTIAERTSAYLLALALGIAVVTGAYAVLRRLDRRGWRPAVRQPLVGAVAIAVVAVGYALLPSSGEPVTVPALLLWDFRIRSLAVLALLYLLLGVAFGLLTDRGERRSTLLTASPF